MKCRQCENELLPGQKKYCSGACRSMAYYIRKHPNRMPQVERWKAEHEQAINKNQRTCKHCGKGFVMVRHSKGIFCSKKCRGRFRSQQPKKPKAMKPPKHCKICGKEIPPGRSVYCGIECVNQKERARYYSNREGILSRMRDKWWQGREQREPFECRECGKIVIPKYETGDSRRTKFCSVKCGNRYSHRARGNSHVKRARYFGVDYQAVDPIRVFVRDGWRCQLCHKKLKRIDRGTTKDAAPELDHIIPLSKGGEHSYRNTQCVCRKCNSDKGDQERGQLRMFG